MNRLDRLKEQHPDLNVSLIDIISFLDPTDSYKYTEFLIKNFKNDSQYYSTDKYEFMGLMGVFLFGSGEIETLNEFERHSKANRIKNKDISQYTNFLELNNEIKVATEIENRRKLEKEILKIYEDDTWFILTPLSLEASQVYGANTKWCVTQEKYWKQYLITHRLIYVLNKKTDTKIAFSRDFNKNKFQAWDELDKEADPMFVNFIPDELFLKIRKELQEDKTTGDLIGWGDNVSTIRRISDYPGVMTYDNTDGIISINGTNGEITTINNNSRSYTPSNDIVETIKRLIRTQPRQQLQTISNEPSNIQTISNNLGLNYVFEYNDRPYLDDLP